MFSERRRKNIVPIIKLLCLSSVNIYMSFTITNPNYCSVSLMSDNVESWNNCNIYISTQHTKNVCIFINCINVHKLYNLLYRVSELSSTGLSELNFERLKINEFVSFMCLCVFNFIFNFFRQTHVCYKQWYQTRKIALSKRPLLHKLFYWNIARRRNFTFFQA